MGVGVRVIVGAFHRKRLLWTHLILSTLSIWSHIMHVLAQFWQDSLQETLNWHWVNLLPNRGSTSWYASVILGRYFIVQSPPIWKEVGFHDKTHSYLFEIHCLWLTMLAHSHAFLFQLKCSSHCAQTLHTSTSHIFPTKEFESPWPAVLVCITPKCDLCCAVVKQHFVHNCATISLS